MHGQDRRKLRQFTISALVSRGTHLLWLLTQLSLQLLQHTCAVLELSNHLIHVDTHTINCKVVHGSVQSVHHRGVALHELRQKGH